MRPTNPLPGSLALIAALTVGLCATGPVWTSGQMQAIESEGFADLPTGVRIWYSDTGGS